MKIYNVIWDDRHTDTTATPFLKSAEAIEWARMQAKEMCRFPKDFKEENIEGWVYYVRYSCEDDCLWVTEHEI